ncbi:MAG: peptidoglycan bridge formation glycyltransferase FemA/FemB family protein, partial [bacterium]
MLRLVENRPDDWNRWIQESGSGFLQSWEWGEFQAAAGHGVRRYKVENDGEVLARFSLYLYALPFGQRYGFVPMGPVVAGEKAENFRRAIDELRKVVHQEGLVIARVEPFDNCSDRSVLKGLGLKPAPAFSPADTSIVDLSLEPDGLLAAMKPKTRYNIRLAEKRGVTVRQADPLDGATYAKDIASFQSLLAETARRDGFYTHVPDYYGRLLHKLAPNKSDEMSVRLFLAEHDGQPLAGALVSGFGDMATYLHGASSS